MVRLRGGEAAVIEPARLRESFRVEPGRVQYDAEGAPRAVLPVRVWQAWGPEMLYLLDMAQDEVVAVTTFEKGADYHTNRTQFRYPAGAPMLCGLTNALQRGEGGAEAALFRHPCRRAHFAAKGGESFVRVRADPWGDQVAWGYQQAGVPGVVLAWFVPTIPYPVRLLEQLDDDEEPRFAVLDLVEFRRGQDDPLPDVADIPSLPPIRLAPHAGVGPDETGIRHPYPLSQAWSDARGHHAVRDYLERHPRAVVRDATYNEEVLESRQDVRETRTHRDAWYIVLDDGTSTLAFSIKRAESTTRARVPGIGTLPLSSGTTNSLEVGPAMPPIPAVTQRPPVLPDVGSSLVWWEALATRHFQEQGANGYLHRLVGEDGSPAGVTAVGRLRGEARGAQWLWEASYLSVDHQGRAVT
ncbi:MAG TPA: hypothetical protein VFH47_06455, partial [Candidatus Thermoplasmatota archaeon]|nr:hypothetical protein [Candidatus Thermoplasmatota archaeon]